MRKSHTEGGTRATIKVEQDSVTFEYDIMLDKTALNNEIRQSYGMGIVRKLQNAPTFK